MAYKRILLDTNTYLRIGKSIKPLLGIPLGKQQLALYLLNQAQKELDTVTKLKTKFNWVQQEEYKKERKKIITTTREEKVQIEDAWEHIWYLQKEKNYGLSPVDIYCIATALVLGIKLVSDEINIKLTADEFGVDIINTVELLKILVAVEKIDINQVKGIISYLKYLKDFPHFLNETYRSIFGEKTPE
jgi:hypothetical protein